jgi:hypothetical protein
MEHSILEISLGVILIYLLICAACAITICYIYKELDFLKSFLTYLKIGLVFGFFLAILLLILYKLIL